MEKYLQQTLEEMLLSIEKLVNIDSDTFTFVKVGINQMRAILKGNIPFCRKYKSKGGVDFTE